MTPRAPISRAPIARKTARTPATLAAGLAFAAVLSLGAAQAEDAAKPAFDGALTESCLTGKTGASARAACIGVAAEACMAQEAGQTTVGMVSCLSDEFEGWDKRLNATYGQLMDSQTAADVALKETATAQPAAHEETLRAMQKAWISYRDAACAFDAAQWDGGTGAGPSAAQCMLQLTAEQTLFLEGYLPENRQ